MALFVLAYIAGVMTVAAPCILPLLPIIVGGSVSPGDKESKKDWQRPVVITLSLAVSVIVFTLLLRASTALLGIPEKVWMTVSGLIVILFGISLIFPSLWEKFMAATRLANKANQLSAASYKQSGLKRDILLGGALGPVFNSCSPTYALIVASILPASFGKGFLLLVTYALGLASVLLLVAAAGQTVVKKLGWLSNPEGLFRRGLGVLFVIVGLAVIFGLDRDFQTFLLDQGWYDPIVQIEERLGL